MSTYIHLSAAIWLILSGAVQLLMKKGTKPHKVVGWSWMVAMVVVAISSFGIPGILDWFYGYGPIHLLSIWVLICVVVSLVAVQKGNIRIHKAYTVGAYLGAIGAGIAAMLVPDRLIYNFLFG